MASTPFRSVRRTTVAATPIDISSTSATSYDRPLSSLPAGRPARRSR
jgi:hypothetical protein